MEKYVLNIKNLASISIYTNIDAIIKKLASTISVTKTIPVDISYKGTINKIDSDTNYITIFKGNGKSVYINIEKNIASLITNKEEFFFPDLVYLTISMFANILQKKEYYFIQSSVVKYDDKKSLMFIGDPSSGKTTMAYSLMKEHGYKLISNDNVLVGMENKNLVTLTGTKPMQMRYGALKSYFPEILPYVKVNEKDMTRNDWDIKLYIDEYLKNNNYGYADESIVTDIYNIKTYKDGNAIIREREPIDKLLLIYEHLTKQIRSNRYALVDFDYAIPSFEASDCIQDRYNMSKKICETVNFYDAVGSVKELTKRIGMKYEK